MFRGFKKLFTCSNINIESAMNPVKRSQVQHYDLLNLSEDLKKFYVSEDKMKLAAKSKTNTGDTIVDVDVDEDDEKPRLCATMIRDIYINLRASEANAKKRPCIDYMQKVQKDITISMRKTVIDWLVDVALVHELDSETLYLSVNYIDRYLSGNSINQENLQLLGVACMMIASKYEETDPPSVQKFRKVTANTYSEDEILRMETTVLHCLKFQLTVPTVSSFLSRFVYVAKAVTRALPVELECMSNYLAELSLLDYSMLGYAPSQIAASSVFLARYILSPSTRPWNSTLQHYTLYKPSELLECVRALHRLCFDDDNAVGEKYSHHKYMFVANKYCPPSIPREYFQDKEAVKLCLR